MALLGVAEKTVWRFGADQCDEKYASCRSYSAPSKKFWGRAGTDPATNQVVPFMRNTFVDYAPCNVEEHRVFGHAMNLSVPGGPYQLATGGRCRRRLTFTAGDGSSLTMPRIYFDKTVKPAARRAKGAPWSWRSSLGASALNLLENSSFGA